MADKEDVANDLLGVSTVKRRKAAIAAREIGDALCCDLAEALKMELGGKSWQTQVELAKSLGILRCSSSEDVLREIVFSSETLEFDLVKMQAAKALVRVTRENLGDSSTVKALLDAGGYSVREGALEAIGYDRMVFDVEDCVSLIEQCWDFGKDRPRGYTDPRYGLAAACAGWNEDVTHKFLKHCLEAGDTPLSFVAENSLRGEYVKLR